MRGSYIGGLNTISVEVELRANVNLATGSVSRRLPESAGPHCGMTGTVTVGGEDSEFSSFGLVKGTLDPTLSERVYDTFYLVSLRDNLSRKTRTTRLLASHLHLVGHTDPCLHLETLRLDSYL
jgi:hypothetical protein